MKAFDVKANRMGYDMHLVLISHHNAEVILKSYGLCYKTRNSTWLDQKQHQSETHTYVDLDFTVTYCSGSQIKCLTIKSILTKNKLVQSLKSRFPTATTDSYSSANQDERKQSTFMKKAMENINQSTDLK